MQDTSTALQPRVQIIKGVPMTTSLQVAEHFEKEHYNVLRDIRAEIQAHADPAFTSRHFIDAIHVNGQGKEIPIFRLTEIGFSLIAMGFTGAKAKRWQRAYVQTFAAMREDIARRDQEAANARATRRRPSPARLPGVSLERQYANEVQARLLTVLSKVDSAFIVALFRVLALDRLPIAREPMDLMVRSVSGTADIRAIRSQTRGRFSDQTLRTAARRLVELGVVNQHMRPRGSRAGRQVSSFQACVRELSELLAREAEGEAASAMADSALLAELAQQVADRLAGRTEETDPGTPVLH